MRRLSTLWLAMTWMLVGMPLALAQHPPGIPAPASLNSITVADSPVGKEILLQIDGEYSFQTVHEPEGALYVELHGPRIGSLSPSDALGQGTSCRLSINRIHGRQRPARGADGDSDPRLGAAQRRAGKLGPAASVGPERTRLRRFRPACHRVGVLSRHDHRRADVCFGRLVKTKGLQGKSRLMWPQQSPQPSMSTNLTTRIVS